MSGTPLGLSRITDSTSATRIIQGESIRAVDGHDPGPAILHKRHAIVVWRNDGSVAVADEFRFSAGRRYGPHLNPGLNRVACRIWWALTASVRSVIPSAHVHDRLAVARKRELR